MKNFIRLLISSLLCWAMSASLFAAENTTPSSPGGQQTQETDYLPDDLPGSIIEELKEDAEKKDYLFTGFGESLKPWREWKDGLHQEHAFRFGISLTTYYQNASDSIGTEDDAASVDLNIDGAWTFAGKDTDSPTTLGCAMLWRDDIGTELTPLTLFTQTGSLYSGGAGYSDDLGPAISELWIQKKFSRSFGFRVGKIFPVTAYDFFPFKNFRSDFVDFNNVTNATIPLPDYGYGGLIMYKPQPNVYLRLGVHDANADVEKSGFDTYDGELFTIFEVGFDPGRMPRKPGRPPFGDVHVSIWHQDKLDKAGVDDGWGISVTAQQRYGRYTPFVRFGYADVEINGPTSVENLATFGLVTDGIFGQANDRIGVSYSWTEPVDKLLDDQSAIDAYYRVHLTQHLAFSPTLQIVFDPVRNPNEDEIYVFGARLRLVL